MAAWSVTTVCGAPLDAGAPVWFDAHAHAWIAPPPGVAEEVALRLDDDATLASGLAAFRTAAAPRRAGLLDCQPPGAGRDAMKLAELAERSGVAIACVTGFHLAPYYPGGTLPYASPAAAAERFVSELDEELAELPGRRAAAVKGAHRGVVDERDEPWWEAVAEAQRRTGALLLVHTEAGRGVEELVAWLDERGVPPSRLFLCHVDKRPDLALHRELAGSGVLLGFDTFLRPKYDPERRVWPLLHALLADDLGAHLALGLDLAPAAMWSRATHPGAAGAGPAALLDVVVARLQRDGVDPETVDALVGGNVLQRLSRAPAAAARPAEHAWASSPLDAGRSS
jgi:5-phospho-D-xylono-1,4-lactonase